MTSPEQELNIESQQTPEEESAAAEQNRAGFFSKRNLLALVGIASTAFTGAPSLEATAAAAQPYHNKLVANPLHDSKGNMISCPDPNATKDPHSDNIYVVCTTDYSQGEDYNHKNAAFKLYKTKDGVHLKDAGYIFAPGKEPKWAIESNGTGLAGRYWAPELNYIRGKWIVYFAAEYNANAVNLRANGKKLEPQTMVIGAGSTHSSSPEHAKWQTRVIQYPGKENSVPGSYKEFVGGDIDPTEVPDPKTGQPLLLFTNQPNRTLVAGLSADGTHIVGPAYYAFGANQPWECSTNRQGKYGCVVEGTAAYNHNGMTYALFSANSTWNGRYSVGVAASPDPLHVPFTINPQPILTPRPGLVDSGGESQPVVTSRGNALEYFHVQTHPIHESTQRYLAIGGFSYSGGGSTEHTFFEKASTASQMDKVSKANVPVNYTVNWPSISDGHPKKYNVIATTASTNQIFQKSVPAQ